MTSANRGHDVVNFWLRKWFGNITLEGGEKCDITELHRLIDDVGVITENDLYNGRASKLFAAATRGEEMI
jgi:hypothetical protein